MAGVVKPRGPHHFASSCGSVHARNTAAAGARRTRFIHSTSSLGCTVTTHLLMGCGRPLKGSHPAASSHNDPEAPSPAPTQVMVPEMRCIVSGRVLGGGKRAKLGAQQLSHRIPRQLIHEPDQGGRLVGGQVFPAECQDLLFGYR